jgi:hypothetical protein
MPPPRHATTLGAIVWVVLYRVLNSDCPHHATGVASNLGLSFMPPCSALGNWRSRAEGRAVAFHTTDAHGLYSQLGFLPADETVMQRPRPAAT